ncbi:MAG: hypothetical protein V7K88_02730 [Nostoc sp.]|uniref:hypothetical protein n=1 Tax=Nostoc sp. TaxID=1180 RepID=UPI002FF9864D
MLIEKLRLLVRLFFKLKAEYISIFDFYESYNFTSFKTGAIAILRKGAFQKLYSVTAIALYTDFIDVQV